MFNYEHVLLYQDKLRVPGNPDLLLQLIRNVHDQPSSEHPGIRRPIDMLRRDYYIQRSKAPRDKYNGRVVPAAILTQRWTDISMEFITGLPDSEGHNAICTVVDRLTRERHYIACTAIDEGTSAEATADILLHSRDCDRFPGPRALFRPISQVPRESLI